jgi:aspartate/methionine/tyrosine aminotransferase
LPDPAALKKLINSRTRLVCLTNLHNPTHVRMSAELIGEIVQMCRAENVFLMIDEAYLPFVERAHHKHAFAGGAISINSLCKAWGLSNLRVGWAVGDPAIIEKCYRLNNLLGVNQPYVTEHLAYQIMSRPDALSYLIARAEKAAAGRKYLHDFLAQTPEIICTPPAGGVSAWLKLPAGMDERKLISMLVLKFSTVCFPGFLFAAPGHIRVSYGSDPARMQTGFQNLRSALQECA